MSIGELTDLMRKWGAVPTDWRHFMAELESATIDTDKVLEERSAQLLETARKLAEAGARIAKLENALRTLLDHPEDKLAYWQTDEAGPTSITLVPGHFRIAVEALNG